ncbi:unnamed protein product [Arabis nemorensis]|uniref:Ubiquitin-like protease family profile domain-containing protein n=1 Tax=Arabis nemorensis TaxID=586526 RepID=A0A565CPQ8_9BRAS|nr:unnamed protein product [Arabis nemorensis]
MEKSKVKGGEKLAVEDGEKGGEQLNENVKSNAAPPTVAVEKGENDDQNNMHHGISDVGVTTPKGKGYNPFEPVDKQKVKVLEDWLAVDLYIVKHTSAECYWILREPKEFLKDSHMDAAISLLRFRYSNHPEWFTSKKICFVDTILFAMWTAKYEEFVDFLANPDGSGKLLPAGALDYQKGLEPTYCRSNKLWGMEVDDIYNPLHIKGNHWVTLWISLSKRHIIVWDSILSYAKDEEIDVAVEP